jgi:hypothetical protein
MWKTVILASSLVLLIFAVSAGYSTGNIQQGRRCTVSIKNGSSRDFYRLHISWNRDRAWGPNLLQGPLRPGMAVDQVLVPADYDVMAVDANDTPCVLKGVSVSNNMALLITDQHCQR